MESDFLEQCIFEGYLGIEPDLLIKENSLENYQIEKTTVWSFPDRGNWSTHNSSYRGNWSPYIPRNVILRYSNVGDLLLDQFLGSGTTLIEAVLLNRKGIGFDINPKAIEISERNLRPIITCNSYIKTIKGDASNLYSIPDHSIDLICTHPPYSNIIQYSNKIEGDLSLLNIDQFLIKMKLVASESFRVLKSDKYCAILMGDVRRKQNIIPLGFKVMNIFMEEGFILKEIVIKEQHNCRATEFWVKRSFDQNFLLIAHEYLFIFRKP